METTRRLLSATALALIFAIGPIGRAAGGQDITKRLALCTTCHGEAGIPAGPEIPIIWGQHFYYLYVQLKDYQAGRRTSDIMGPVVADMTKEEMQALAKHFSEQPWPVVPYGASPADVERAKTAAVGGVCTECHLGNYHGSSGTPRVAGQQRAYLFKTMVALKTKARQNAPAKSSLFATFPEEDLKALSEYLAGL